MRRWVRLCLNCSAYHCLFLALVIVLPGCGKKQLVLPQGQTKTRVKQISPLDYTIQAGAFAQIDNALGLTETLETFGLEPYYFRHSSGLYKVRFGNFSTRQAAEIRARKLLNSGYIADYYIVNPKEYSLASLETQGSGYLRKQIVETAEGFLGLPYRWGGTRAEEGFDCSGLTMAVYRLNGLHLPRTSREQFKTGHPVSLDALSKGDLVFFAASATKRVSHVGVYTGNGSFIHAPSKGKTVRISSLNSHYYQKNYSGARTYLSR